MWTAHPYPHRTAWTPTSGPHDVKRYHEENAFLVVTEVLKNIPGLLIRWGGPAGLSRELGSQLRCITTKVCWARSAKGKAPGTKSGGNQQVSGYPFCREAQRTHLTHQLRAVTTRVRCYLPGTHIRESSTRVFFFFNQDLVTQVSSAWNVPNF